MVQRKTKVGENPELDAHIAALVEQRDVGQRALAHLRFVDDHFVDQTLVQTALDAGLSQGEVADQFGMSKRDVNRRANRVIDADGQRAAAPEFDRLRAAFLETVCDSRTRAYAIERDCTEFDGQCMSDAEWSARTDESVRACTRCADHRPRAAVVNLDDPAVIADALAVLITHSEFPGHSPYRTGSLTFHADTDGDSIIVTMPHPTRIYPDRTFELSVRLIDSGFPPPASAPRLGDLVGAGRRGLDESEQLAQYWTTQLASDPVYGSAASGLVVGVGPQPDGSGLWPLIWVPIETVTVTD